MVDSNLRKNLLMSANNAQQQQQQQQPRTNDVNLTVSEMMSSTPLINSINLAQQRSLAPPASPPRGSELQADSQPTIYFTEVCCYSAAYFRGGGRP